MADRNIVEQYKYETEVRGLSHEDALLQMVYMFPAEQLDILEGIYEAGRHKGLEEAY